MTAAQKHKPAKRAPKVKPKRATLIPLNAAPAATAVDLAAEWIAPGKLKLWANNPRKNDGEPVSKVADSISRFGFGAPIVARRANGEIIAGHTRWKAAIKLGLERVPVRFLDISERDAHLLAVADNRIGEFADWDHRPLHGVLTGYDVNDILVAGWDDKAMRELERAIRGDAELDDAAAPEPPKEPVTKPGDLWVLGKHRLVCGDSSDEKVVSLARAKLSPFIMVTDPPYGVNYDPGWKADAGLHARPSPRQGRVLNDHCASWLGAWKLFTGDVAYVWCAATQSPVVARELDESGFERRSLLVWKKPNFVVGRGHYHWQSETCWYAVREGKSAQWAGDRSQSTVWEISRKDGSEETIHSTQKPIECMARPMRNHGQAGDVVYEPFAGSGTTLIAAEQLERVCVAIELNPAYCDVIVERWQKLTGGKARRNP